MKVFDATATRSALPFAPLAQALRRLFTEGCEVPPRHVHQVAGVAGAPPMTVLIMPAWRPGRHLGIKTVNIAPGNAARGLPGLHAAYLLFDAATGEPVALLDGNEITARRTAAASALAASMLARPQAGHLLVVGTGRVAQLLAPAYQALLPIGRVSVWGRRPAAAEAVAQAWRDQGLAATACTDLARAAGEADIVSCATLATEPVVHGRWLRPDSHLDLIGSFTPAMREADDDCFRGARVYVDTDEALAKSGDLLGALAAGVLQQAQVAGTLAQLCRGERPGRGPQDGRTVFKSVGTALEDLAAAELAWATLGRADDLPVAAGPPSPFTAAPTAATASRPRPGGTTP